jgi:hypothetical protein
MVSGLRLWCRLCSLVVLADQAVEQLSLWDRQVQREGGLGALIGYPLLAGLVRPVPVAMVGVLDEYAGHYTSIARTGLGICDRQTATTSLMAEIAGLSTARIRRRRVLVELIIEYEWAA